MTNLLDSTSIHPLAQELGELFVAAGFELALVGGPVRDLLLGQNSSDLDFTTNAHPDQTIELVQHWADALWEIGKEYGTIGIRKRNTMIEITTYRAEAYTADSRKPAVVFGTSLQEDLFRRDFTINAMALRLPQLALIDPYGGIRDLSSGLIQTPGKAEDSFSDDPLRMMRAARFAARFNMELAPEVLAAMTHMAQRITVISAERVRDELVKLINAPFPVIGINLVVDSGLASYILPEIPALQLEVDEHHRHKDVYQHSLRVLEQAAAQETDAAGAVPGPDFILRFAALMHDIGKPATRKFESNGSVSFLHHDLVGAKLVKKRMRALRFDNETTKAVARLVELHMRFYGYGDSGWSDAAVRRYVRDAGDLLERLHRLTRADVTTRNKRKAQRISRAYDDLENRIEQLAHQEELAALRPELNGEQIMALLDIPPGPAVGKAYKYLLDLRLDEGLLGQEQVILRLRQWAEQNL
ncbi:MAG: CCA tRNA nucleotidyltransferase [Rothia sp. (in: high G+C Gram-positive bacteria)]|nr:CCA tRNA nucleotidyltransferase [Rothia sp. (in: high G+C Gram-positive bacteria)]